MDIPQWQSADVQERLQASQPLQIVDVRQPEEFDGGHVPGAKLIPLGELADRYQEIAPDMDVVVVCRSGGRSMKACEFLGAMGYRNMYNLAGGMLQWSGEIE